MDQGLDLIGLVRDYPLQFMVILSVVVFVHEFGHYWVAVRNDVRVESFSIGFGPELFGWTDRVGTRWKLSAIPLGGYVKMQGDADVASTTVDVARAADPQSFPAKRVGQRAAIVAAGPAANFLFAIAALALLFMLNGRPVTPPVVGGVEAGSPAATAGLLPGDRILEVDGSPVASFENLQTIVRASAGRPLALAIEREGERTALTVTPAGRPVGEGEGGSGRVGISSAAVEFVRSSPWAAPWHAVVETAGIVKGTLVAIGQMIVGSRSTEELGGPLRIAQMAGEAFKAGPVTVLWFTAILSINLGLINLFPIPMLDGGHLVFYGIEAARGRPMNDRAQEIALRIGLAMVLTLMVFATWNDVSRMVLTAWQGIVDSSIGIASGSRLS